MKTTRSNESIERTENKSKRSLLESHICLSQKVKQARHQKINTQTKCILNYNKINKYIAIYLKT